MGQDDIFYKEDQQDLEDFYDNEYGEYEGEQEGEDGEIYFYDEDQYIDEQIFIDKQNYLQILDESTGNSIYYCADDFYKKENDSVLMNRLCQERKNEDYSYYFFNYVECDDECGKCVQIFCFTNEITIDQNMPDIYVANIGEYTFQICNINDWNSLQLVYNYNGSESDGQKEVDITDFQLLSLEPLEDYIITNLQCGYGAKNLFDCYFDIKPKKLVSDGSDLCGIKITEEKLNDMEHHLYTNSGDILMYKNNENTYGHVCPEMEVIQSLDFQRYMVDFCVKSGYDYLNYYTVSEQNCNAQFNGIYGDIQYTGVLQQCEYKLQNKDEADEGEEERYQSENNEDINVLADGICMKDITEQDKNHCGNAMEYCLLVDCQKIFFDVEKLFVNEFGILQYNLNDREVVDIKDDDFNDIGYEVLEEICQNQFGAQYKDFQSSQECHDNKNDINNFGVYLNCEGKLNECKIFKHQNLENVTNNCLKLNCQGVDYQVYKNQDKEDGENNESQSQSENDEDSDTDQDDNDNDGEENTNEKQNQDGEGKIDENSENRIDSDGEDGEQNNDTNENTEYYEDFYVNQNQFGSIEIYYKGKFNQICNQFAQITNKEANNLCKALGFKAVRNIYSEFCEGSDNFIHDLKCQTPYLGLQNCEIQDYEEKLNSQCNECVQLDCVNFQVEEITIENEKLEALISNQKYQYCHDNIDDKYTFAQKICLENNYGGVRQIKEELCEENPLSQFLDYIQCRPDFKYAEDCDVLITNECDNLSCLGIECQQESIQNGTVQRFGNQEFILENGNWYQLCYDLITEDEAQIICLNKGYQGIDKIQAIDCDQVIKAQFYDGYINGRDFEQSNKCVETQNSCVQIKCIGQNEDGENNNKSENNQGNEDSDNENNEESENEQDNDEDSDNDEQLDGENQDQGDKQGNNQGSHNGEDGDADDQNNEQDDGDNNDNDDDQNGENEDSEKQSENSDDSEDENSDDEGTIQGGNHGKYNDDGTQKDINDNDNTKQNNSDNDGPKNTHNNVDGSQEKQKNIKQDFFTQMDENMIKIAEKVGLGNLDIMYIYFIFCTLILSILGLVIYFIRKFCCDDRKRRRKLFSREHSLEDHRLNIEMPEQLDSNNNKQKRPKRGQKRRKSKQKISQDENNSLQHQNISYPTLQLENNFMGDSNERKNQQSNQIITDQESDDEEQQYDFQA